jgi:hypothetical protein
MLINISGGGQACVVEVNLQFIEQSVKDIEFFHVFELLVEPSKTKYVCIYDKGAETTLQAANYDPW